MKIGLLSDSHGDAAVTRQAVQALVDQHTDLMLHLGDICDPAVIDELIVQPPNADQPIEARIVLGNMDWERNDLTRYAQSLGVHVDDPVGTLDVEGKRLVYLHGDDSAAMARALAERVDYLCHGHTHVALDKKIGPTRVINPGALHRARRYTAAVLDTGSDTLDFIDIPKK